MMVNEYAPIDPGRPLLIHEQLVSAFVAFINHKAIYRSTDLIRLPLGPQRDTGIYVAHFVGSMDWRQIDN
jgi:hypothetical protein